MCSARDHHGGYKQFRFLQFPYFYDVELAKRDSDLFFVRHTYGPNPSVKDSSQLQTLYSQLDFRLSCSAGGSDLKLECSFRSLFLRLSVKQTQGASGTSQGVPMRSILHLLLTVSQNYAKKWDGDPSAQDWSGGLDELRRSGWVTCVWPLVG